MRFETAPLPERERFAAFREGFGHYIATEIIKDDERPFHAALSIWRGRTLSLATLETSPTQFLRSRETLHDDDASLSVILCRRGRYAASQFEHRQTLMPGDAILFDHGNVAAVQALAPSRRWSIKLPRASLLKLAPQAEQHAGQKFAKNSLALRLLFHHLQAARTPGLVPGQPITDLFEEHALHLAAHLIGLAPAARELVENGGLRQARLRAILHEIETCYGQPELNAETVAARLGVTPRYVHRLLEETGKTFSEYVLDRRLTAAMDLLRDTRHHGRKIVDLAMEAGFSDLSHFNRRFRRRFGDTPSSVRRMALNDDG